MYNLQGQSEYRQQVGLQQAKLAVEVKLGAGSRLLPVSYGAGTFTPKVRVP